MTAKRYHRIMQRRLKWGGSNSSGEDDEDEWLGDGAAAGRQRHGEAEEEEDDGGRHRRGAGRRQDPGGDPADPGWADRFFAERMEARRRERREDEGWFVDLTLQPDPELDVPEDDDGGPGAWDLGPGPGVLWLRLWELAWAGLGGGCCGALG